MLYLYSFNLHFLPFISTFIEDMIQNALLRIILDKQELQNYNIYLWR